MIIVSWLGEMGNQITAIAPAQILPLENYFNDLTEFSKPVRLVWKLGWLLTVFSAKLIRCQ